jgi:hypothetical protein
VDGARRRRRGEPGEIDTLLDLLTEHRGAFEHDWRVRFHLPVKIIGTDAMTYGEAWRHVTILLGDMSSHLAAAVAGWPSPMSRTDATIRDLYDLQYRMKAGRKAQDYPRPWDERGRTIGGDNVVSIEEFRAIKDALAAVQPRPRDARGRFIKQD